MSKRCAALVMIGGIVVSVAVVLLAIHFFRDGLFEDYSEVDFADRIAETGITPWKFDADDPLLAERKILIAGQINERTSREVVYKLLYLDAAGSAPIDLYLLTTGGWTDDAFAMIDTIRSVKAPVNTFALGGCSSAGAMVLACATGIRYCYPNAVIMVHSNLEKSGDKYSSEISDAHRIERFWRMSARLPEDWFPLTGEKEYYLNAQEAKDFGIVDEIVETMPYDKADERG